MPTKVRKNQTGLGILAIIAGVFLVALHDAMVKLFAADLSLSQFFTLRSALALPILVTIIALRPNARKSFAGLKDKWVLIRSLCLLCMYLSLYTALLFVPLATLAAGFYIAPIFIALMSALLIGEPVSGKSWIAILLGFLGVLVSLDLFSDSFTPWAIVPILSGFFYALTAIVTRSKCQAHHPLSLALSLVTVIGITGLLITIVLSGLNLDADIVARVPFIFGPWAQMSLELWGVIALLTVLFLGLGILVATAYKIAPPAIIASFDYSNLVFAAILGFVFFAEIPSAMTTLGMVLIIAAGIYAARVAD